MAKSPFANRRRVVLTTCLAAVAWCQGCRVTDNATARETGPAAPQTPQDVMPEDPRSERAEALFQVAVRGLSFETGFVDVVDLLDRSDRSVAMRHQAEGLEALESNRFTDAVARLTFAVRAAPDWPVAYHGLGQALEAKGRTEHAVASYRTALRLEPGRVDARFDLASALARLGREHEAIEEMERVCELDPQRGEAQERLAIWSYYTGDNAAAWRHVHAAHDLGRTLPPQFMALLEGQMAEPERD
ncbi:MAG: tetratricopeptide repeat protein [Planctomycetota bacterium]